MASMPVGHLAALQLAGKQVLCLPLVSSQCCCIAFRPTLSSLCYESPLWMRLQLRHLQNQPPPLRLKRGAAVVLSLCHQRFLGTPCLLHSGRRWRHRAEECGKCRYVFGEIPSRHAVRPHVSVACKLSTLRHLLELWHAERSLLLSVHRDVESLLLWWRGRHARCSCTHARLLLCLLHAWLRHLSGHLPSHLVGHRKSHAHSHSVSGHVSAVGGSFG